MGGVTIDVKDNEVSYVNGSVDEQAKATGKPATHISGSGTQTLNGIQAVAYSRIRYVGNGDFERTERQDVYKRQR